MQSPLSRDSPAILEEMNMSLTGKVAIVTGAGRGIGRAIALRLTKAGVPVLAAARTAADLNQTASLAAGHPGRCVGMAADLTRSDEVNALVARARSEFGRLDILINNAGLAPVSPVETMSDEVFHQLGAINMDAVFYTCRAAWADLRATRGTIINISSLAAFDPFPGFAAYGASKAWVNLFSKALAAEGKSVGIKVFAVAPGAVATEMLRQAFPEFPADKTLQPDDIAGMVELLLDDRCNHSTGQVVMVSL